MPEEATEYLKNVAAAVLRVMRRHGELPLRELIRKVNSTHTASEPSVRKALHWLIAEHDAPLHYNRQLLKWVLQRRDFSLPLLDPTADDVVAVAFASALLSPLGDKALDQRIQSLLAELDERASASGQTRKLRTNAVTASASAITAIDPRVVVTLARAVGREVVRIQYFSPWQDDLKVRTHVIEPWQLRVHDSNLYVRGFLRGRAAPATFRLAQITSVVVTGERPERPRPPIDEVWPNNSTMSVDVDRPNTATIQVRGAIARHVSSARWHAQQQDRWLEKQQLLERTFAYESCRATARRLLGLGDALVRVEPVELREEVRAHVDALRASMA